MTGVAIGFATIGVVIGVGYLLARLGIVDERGQQVLARVSFNAAMPALFITMLSRTDVRVIFSAHLTVSLLSVFVVSVTAVLLARLAWRRTVPDTVVAAFGASYVNAANLGLPMAAYVLGDATRVVPMLLTQLMLLQPFGLAVLDVATARERGTHLTPWRLVLRPLRNPLTIGTLIGVGLALTGTHLPAALDAPLTLLGGFAVPANLLAFGISLRFGPRPGRGEPVAQLATLVGLKLVAQPLLAYALAAHAWHLAPAEVMAITVIAALPTAQNVFVNATQYRAGVVLARDVVFLTTIASIPVLLTIALALHPR
ncbi:AEC family transporter [Mariniluteicoccus flavus]